MHINDLIERVTQLEAKLIILVEQLQKHKGFTNLSVEAEEPPPEPELPNDDAKEVLPDSPEPHE